MSPFLRPLSVVCLLSCLSVASLAACSGSTPTAPDPVDVLDITFVYESFVREDNPPPVDSGFCAHHMLGHSWLDLYDGNELVNAISLWRQDDGRWRGTAGQVPTDRPLVALIRDLACCNVAGVCEPVQGLMANGVPVSRIAAVSLPGGAQRGVGFRISRSGQIIP
jgi:hypothetical protein